MSIVMEMVNGGVLSPKGAVQIMDMIIKQIMVDIKLGPPLVLDPYVRYKLVAGTLALTRYFFMHVDYAAKFG